MSAGAEICDGRVVVVEQLATVDGVQVFAGTYDGEPCVAWVLTAAASERAAREFAIRATLLQVFEHPLFGGPWIGSPRWVIGPRPVGQNLAQVIGANGAWGLERAEQVGQELAEGLVELHALGLAHGDLGPETVFVTPDGVKVGGLLPTAWRPGVHGDTVAPHATSGAAADLYGWAMLVRFIATGSMEPVPGRLGTIADTYCGTDAAKLSAEQLYSTLRDDNADTEPLAAPGAAERKQLGPWTILRSLGEGGFAEVYLARDANGRTAALKVLTRTAEAPGVDARRFQREAEIVAGLRAPGTIRLIDHGRAMNSLYIAFERVEGDTVSELLKKYGWFPAAEVERVARVLLESLDEAHRAGVVHRDLKPANVMLAAGGVVKLLDFGIAHVQADLLTSTTSLTATGAILGTPQYVAPESIRESGRVGPASDLYSLGLVMYAMLTGVPAVTGDSAFDCMAAHLSTEPLRLPARAPDGSAWPPRLARAVNECLEKDVRERPGSARAVLALLDGRPTHLAPERHPSPAATEPSGTSKPSTWRIAALALVIAVGLAATVLIFTPPAEPPPEVAESPMALPQASNRPPPADPSEPPPDIEAESPHGCGQPSEEGMRQLTALLGLRSISWHVWVPRGYTGEERLPAVVVAHDLSMNDKGAIQSTRFDELADEEGFIVIAPHDPQAAPTPPWWGSDHPIVRRVIEATQQRLCVDPERLFIVGLGAGGRPAEDLTCEMDVAAIATSGFRSRTDGLCVPDRPVPHIHLAPLKDGYNPVEGGSNCGAGEKISLARKEELWRERNGCTGKRNVELESSGGTCFNWTCDEPFVSCHLDGGRRWKHMKARLIHLLPCDGEPAEFNHRDVIWDFFKQVDAQRISPSGQGDEREQ